jgi:hypothetical protein
VMVLGCAGSSIEFCHSSSIHIHSRYVNLAGGFVRNFSIALLLTDGDGKPEFVEVVWFSDLLLPLLKFSHHR